ncbi:hypothetical protein ACFLTN_01625 [Chloroflexota bacterium]
MERRLAGFFRRHPVISVIIGFIFNSLPAWLQLFMPTTGSTAVTLLTWLSWLLALVGLGLLIGVIIILRKPTLVDIPAILQKTHDRVNVLVKQYNLQIDDDKLGAMLRDLKNMAISDLTSLSSLLSSGEETFNEFKDNLVTIIEQSQIFMWQWGIVLDNHTNFIKNIKASDKHYKKLKRQLDYVRLPVPDKQVLDSINTFLRVSEGLNSLVLCKPSLCSSKLVAQSIENKGLLLYLDKLDDSVEQQIGEYRRQVAEAIKNYERELRANGK